MVFWLADYGGLKENGPKEGGIIRRHGFVGVNVVLLEEVCHCGGGLWSLIYAQATPIISVHFLLPADQDKCSAPSPDTSPLSICMLLCPMMIMG